MELLKHHESIGFDTIQMKLVRLSKENEFAIHKGNIDKLKGLIKELFQFILDEAIRDNVKPWMMLLNDNDYIGKITRRVIIKEKYVYRCYAARAKISITANGYIYPCDSFVGMKDFCIGNIYDGIDREKQTQFENQSIFNRISCKDCWARFTCGGDCFHNSYITTGNISNPDPIFCELIKYAIQWSVLTVNRLIKEKPETYASLEKFLRIRHHLQHK